MLMTQKHTHKKMLAYAYAYGYAYEPSLCRAQREKNNHIFFFQFWFNCGELLEFLHSVICKI